MKGRGEENKDLVWKERLGVSRKLRCQLEAWAAFTAQTPEE